MSAHPFETELALHSAGDLSGWERFKTAMHVRSCAACRARVEAFRLDRARLADVVGDLPPGINWDRLAAEMTANIHVGLAAGECISALAARPAKTAWLASLNSWNWKPVAAAACLVLVFIAAWWLNLPSTDVAVLGKIWDRAVNRAVNSGDAFAAEPGPVVAASSDGIEFRENGSALGVSASDAPASSVTVSFDGSASALSVDDDTGQVTIATVYVP